MNEAAMTAMLEEIQRGNERASEKLEKILPDDLKGFIDDSITQLRAVYAEELPGRMQARGYPSDTTVAEDLEAFDTQTLIEQVGRILNNFRFFLPNGYYRHATIQKQEEGRSEEKAIITTIDELLASDIYTPEQKAILLGINDPQDKRSQEAKQAYRARVRAILETGAYEHKAATDKREEVMELLRRTDGLFSWIKGEIDRILEAGCTPTQRAALQEMMQKAQREKEEDSPAQTILMLDLFKRLQEMGHNPVIMRT